MNEIVVSAAKMGKYVSLFLLKYMWLILFSHLESLFFATQTKKISWFASTYLQDLAPVSDNDYQECGCFASKYAQ